MIDDEPGGERWLIARACKNCHSLRYDSHYVDGMDWFTTFAIRPSWGRERVGSTSLPWKQEIVHDYSYGHNLFVTREGDSNKLIAVGGQMGGKHYNQHTTGPGYSSSRELRDGLRILTANSFSKVLDGQWTHPKHDSSTFFFGSSITSSRDKRCCFDSVVTIVKHKGRWLVFSRVNLKFWGGRFVQVAKSRGGNIRGPYDRSEILDIQGYSESGGDGNIYFGSVHLHPLDNEMLLGLFPVNLGIDGRSNADGDSFIGMSLSCDGVKWSEFVHVMKSKGRDGRTYDQPVSGIFAANDMVTFYVHRDVEHISPSYASSSKIEQLKFRKDALAAFTQQVTQR
mmetsp:Transcript_36274/g.72134  ORF Transcript_36274/g.72134 Transcript_36274/m.72134 type:complete len:339 (-) Transcript_36274:76-1092(-)